MITNYPPYKTAIVLCDYCGSLITGKAKYNRIRNAFVYLPRHKFQFCNHKCFVSFKKRWKFDKGLNPVKGQLSLPIEESR